MKNQIIPTVTSAVHRPEFFPVPSKGPDPFFGLCRSTWYLLEAEGRSAFVRIRRPGQIRGKVLISYGKARAILGEFEKRNDALSAGGTSAQP